MNKNLEESVSESQPFRWSQNYQNIITVKKYRTVIHRDMAVVADASLPPPTVSALMAASHCYNYQLTHIQYGQNYYIEKIYKENVVKYTRELR